MSDDQRGAVSLYTGISGHLISVALAILAIEGGFLAYVLGNRVVGTWFYALAILTALLFAVSIILGGRAITRSAESGFKGEWSLTSESALYNAQAMLCLVGLIAFLGMASLSGHPKEFSLEEEVQHLQLQIDSATESFDKFRDSLDDLRNRLDSISRDSH